MPFRASKKIVRIEERHPCGGKLDGERQAVKPATYLAHSRTCLEVRRNRPCTQCKQNDGIVLRHGWQRIALLRLDPERFPLVTITFVLGVAASTSAIVEAASITCSKLSAKRRIR